MFSEFTCKANSNYSKLVFYCTVTGRLPVFVAGNRSDSTPVLDQQSQIKRPVCAFLIITLKIIFDLIKNDIRCVTQERHKLDQLADSL